MSALIRAVCGTVQAIPRVVTSAWSDRDLAVLALELERARKALYLELDDRRHQRWTACLVQRGRR
jgi:hypothetical protein